MRDRKMTMVIWAAKYKQIGGPARGAASTRDQKLGLRLRFPMAKRAVSRRLCFFILPLSQGC